MGEKRRNAAASIAQAGMLVSGEFNGDVETLSSTEYYNGSHWVRGPAMPVAIADHCQATLGSDVVVTGGVCIIGLSGMRALC